jgi:hypothetical protein
MIKKLRNQPYAPKVGESSKMGTKRKKKVIREPWFPGLTLKTVLN